MKRFSLILALIAGLLVTVPPTARAASLNQCLQISNIRTTVQGDQISVKADASQVCSEYTPGTSALSAYSPLYQLQPHQITCTGPNLRQGRVSLGISGLYLGEISCSGKSQSYGVGTTSLSAWVPIQGTVTTSFTHTPISASKKLAECIEFSNPRAATSSSTFTLSVDAYSICSFLTREGQIPVVGMLEEDSLLTLGACNGVAINAAPSGRLYLGTISCQLRVGSQNSFLASTRSGATSTTLNLFFTWDFSRVNISVSHPAIPPTVDKAAADAAAAAKAAADKAAADKAAADKAAADKAAADKAAADKAAADKVIADAAAELKAKQEAEAKAAAEAAILKLQIEEFNEVSSAYKEMMKKILGMKSIFPFTSSLLGMEAKMKNLPITLGEDLTTARTNISNVDKWLDTNKKIWEKTQKMVITCIKGKLTKKVTAVNPKCPSGYKLKR
jgi:hypothetical protein